MLDAADHDAMKKEIFFLFPIRSLMFSLLTVVMLMSNLKKVQGQGVSLNIAELNKIPNAL